MTTISEDALELLAKLGESPWAVDADNLVAAAELVTNGLAMAEDDIDAPPALFITDAGKDYLQRKLIPPPK